MPNHSDAGHHLEVLFADSGRTVEIDVDDTDTGAFAVTLVEAIGKDDPRARRPPGRGVRELEPMTFHRREYFAR